MAKADMDIIWYAIYGKLCRGETEAEDEEWRKTVSLVEEKPVHAPVRDDY